MSLRKITNDSFKNDRKCSTPSVVRILERILKLDVIPLKFFKNIIKKKLSHSGKIKVIKYLKTLFLNGLKLLIAIKPPVHSLNA